MFPIKVVVGNRVVTLTTCAKVKVGTVQTLEANLVPDWFIAPITVHSRMLVSGGYFWG
jgi:hypothetical protein